MGPEKKRSKGQEWGLLAFFYLSGVMQFLGTLCYTYLIEDTTSLVAELKGFVSGGRGIQLV